MTHFLVESKAFHKLGIVHGTVEFLHNLDILKIDDIGFAGAITERMESMVGGARRLDY